MNSKRRASGALDYTIAILAVSGALLLHFALADFLHPLPFSTFYLAVLLVAAVARPGAVLLATGLSIAAALYFFMDSSGSFVLPDRGEQARLAAFIAFAVGSAALSEVVRRARQRELDAHGQLTQTLAQQAGNEFIRATLDALPHEIAVIDRAGVILAVNERWIRFAKANCAGADFASVGSNYLESIRAAMAAGDASARQALDGLVSVLGGERAEFTMEYPCKTEEGELWFLMHATRPACEQAGAVISHTEITERKRAEVELRESEERERRRAQELQALLDLAPIGVSIALDAEGREIRGNRASEALYGLPPGAQLSMAASDRPPIAIFKDGRELALEELPMQRASRGETVDDQIIEVRSPDRTLTVLAKATPLYDDARRPRGAVGAFLDITALKQAEDALLDAHRRKDEFLAILAHELRNPLAPIRNAIYVLLKTATDDRAQGLLNMMQRQVDHLVRLVDDLTEISRITRGVIQLERVPLNLTEVVCQAVEMCRPFIERRKHNLVVDLPPSPAIVEGDAVRLTQVITNLLGNAAKFTPERGHISIGVALEGEQAIVRVQDDGVGIDPEFLPRLFELFAQTPNSKKQGGLGIGLSLAREIMELHDGRIEAASEGPGKGSVFTVSLPICEPGGASTHQDHESAFDSGLVRVLVVDDNHDAADSLVLLLDTLGVAARAVYDGQSAIAAVSDFRPQLALMDLGMPVMDGFETARRIRRQPGGENIALVALTGWGQEKHRLLADDAGYDQHLVKPVSVSDLQELFARLSLKQLTAHS